MLVTEFAGNTVWAAGTGYTGEAGAEIVVPAAVGESLLTALVDAGATPCGLGARDTLRLEMGFPLWGQDLGPDITPLEAGLGWVVRWTRDFVGSRRTGSAAGAGSEEAAHGVRHG